MKCPSCATKLAAPEPRCPHCKLTLQKLDAKFGLLPRHSRYLSDRSGRLPLEEMEGLRKMLRLFERKFPQILFSVFLADLPCGTSVAEYAFWLANRVRFSSINKVHGDNFDLLLVIDAGAKAAAITTGYGLERFVGEKDLADALDRLAKGMHKNDLPAAIRACTRSLARRLRELSVKLPKAEPQNEEEESF